MFKLQEDSISYAKELILKFMESKGVMAIDSGEQREEWIYQRGKFYSYNENSGINFKTLRKHIKRQGTFRLYIFNNGEVVLKVTPEKIVVFD